MSVSLHEPPLLILIVILILLLIGSWSQCTRERERGLSMNRTCCFCNLQFSIPNYQLSINRIDSWSQRTRESGRRLPKSNVI
jgi:hypothetical protein